MIKTLFGKAHGKTIELAEDLGLLDGEEIEVQVSTRKHVQSTGEGLLRTEGALANDPEWDDIMRKIYQERKK